MKSATRYYLFFSVFLIPVLVYFSLRIDLVFLAAFLLPVTFSMLFHHPNIFEFSHYKISRYSFVSILFYLKEKMNYSQDSLFFYYLNRHSVSLLFFLLMMLPIPQRLFLLLNYILGVIGFELVYYLYSKKRV